MKNLITIALFSLSNVVYSQEKPNIILILADDLGYGDLGCYGAADIKTPNLDRLASEGVRFTNFYSNAPECTPTRTALLTGRYQQRVGGMECAIGLNDVGRYPEALELSNRNDIGLPVEFNAIPTMLKAKEYNTALIGKWHLGGKEKFRPNVHGFDYSLGPLGGGIDYFHHTEPKGIFIGIEMEGNPDFYRNGLPHRRENYYMTHLITDEAVEWINIQKETRPFFLYLPYTAPHNPYQGPDDYKPEQLTSKEFGIGNRETYVKMIEAMDKGIGKILDKLEEKGIADNTLIIFFSDNGPTKMGTAGVLSGNKSELFEGGIRVPLIMKWPGKIKPAQVSGQMAIGMDITASISGIIGAEPPKPFDGIDIVDHIVSGRNDFPRTLFWRFKRGNLVLKAVRDNSMKYIAETNKNGLTEYLFNLETDIGEKDNLVNKNSAELNRLKTLMDKWEAEVKPERYDFFKVYQ
jgi:arylsulfatase A-like enzyme